MAKALRQGIALLSCKSVAKGTVQMQMQPNPSASWTQVRRALRPPAHRRYGWRSPLRPLVYLLRALGDVPRVGPAVAQTHGIPVHAQVLHLLHMLRRGYSSDDFYRFRMYRSSRADASLFVSLRSNIALRSELYRRLKLDVNALADKRRFGRAAEAAGLPVAVTIADFADGSVHWWKETSLPPVDLFVKEAASMWGAGATTWTWDGQGHWTSEGRALDAPSLLSQLAARSREAPLLLQRRLSNHPDLIDFGPHGLCTVRVVTLRPPAAAVPEVLMAAFRMPVDGDIADNFARGGLACAVDLRDGILGPAARKKLRLAHLDFERHPDTGAQIPGHRLPLWQDVMALALRAHAAFAQFPSVGWDIAITPDGPVLLEGNFNWDVVLVQQAGCRPLGATAWTQHVLEWGRCTASGAGGLAAGASSAGGTA